MSSKALGKRWVWDLYPLKSKSWPAREIDVDGKRPGETIWVRGAKLPTITFGEKDHKPRYRQREFYIPTDYDLSIIRTVFPDVEAHLRPWPSIKSELVAAGHRLDDLREFNAPTLLKLLSDVTNQKKIKLTLTDERSLVEKLLHLLLSQRTQAFRLQEKAYGNNSDRNKSQIVIGVESSKTEVDLILLPLPLNEQLYETLELHWSILKSCQSPPLIFEDSKKTKLWINSNARLREYAASNGFTINDDGRIEDLLESKKPVVKDRIERDESGSGEFSDCDELSSLEATIPALDESAECWISNKVAAKILGVKTKTLTNARHKGKQQAKDKKNDFGLHDEGCFWRRNGKKHPRYYLPRVKDKVGHLVKSTLIPTLNF